MPRSKEQFDQIKQDRKQSILDVGLKLYSIYGDKITIDMISNELKCSHGIIYHYFSNVDEIIKKIKTSETYIYFKASLVKSYDNALASNAIKEIVKSMLLLKNKNDIYHILIMMQEVDKKSLFYIINSLVVRGQKEGDIVGGFPEDTTFTFYNCMKSIYLDIVLFNNKKAHYPSLDNVLNIFLRKRF